jgi:hypothetical protein
MPCNAFKMAADLVRVQFSASFRLNEYAHWFLSDECVWDACITSYLLLECETDRKFRFK